MSLAPSPRILVYINAGFVPERPAIKKGNENNWSVGNEQRYPYMLFILYGGIRKDSRNSTKLCVCGWGMLDGADRSLSPFLIPP